MKTVIRSLPENSKIRAKLGHDGTKNNEIIVVESAENK